MQLFEASSVNSYLVSGVFFFLVSLASFIGYREGLSYFTWVRVGGWRKELEPSLALSMFLIGICYIEFVRTFYRL